MWIMLLALGFIAVRGGLLLWRREPRSWSWWLGWATVAAAAAVALVALRGDLPAQKLVGRLAMPVGLLWLALWGLAIWQLVARRWWVGGAMAACALLFTLAASPYVAGWLMGRLTARVTTTPLSELKGVEAVFVLGGGTASAFTGNGVLDDVSLGAAGDRLALAAELYHAGVTPLLVASGGGIPGLGGPRDLAAETATIWQRLGVPATAIRRLPGPQTTSEEIAAYRDYMVANGWTKVALISSAWHLPRAMRLCRKLGLPMLPVTAEPAGYPLPWSPVFVVPTGEAAQQVQIALWEELGMLVGR